MNANEIMGGIVVGLLVYALLPLAITIYERYKGEQDDK